MPSTIFEQKKITTFALILLTWLLPIIFFLNFSPYFYNSFERYQVLENFNISNDYIVDNFNSMLNYINLRTFSLDQNFFSTEDLIHLRDVRNLVAGLYLITIVLILLTVLNRKLLKEEWLSIVKSSSLINLVLALLLIAIVLLSFNNAFIIFHKLLFRNEYWILDPETSNLIKFFPEEVFFEIAIYTTVFVIIGSILELTLWKLLTKKYL